MIPKTIHLNTEFELPAYHKNNLVDGQNVCCVNMSAEFRVDKKPEAESQEEQNAKNYLREFLNEIGNSELFLYQIISKTGAGYRAEKVEDAELEPTPVPTGQSIDFLGWVEQRNASFKAIDLPPHSFCTVLLQNEDTAVDQDCQSVSVGQLMQANTMLNAPVPQRLGQTRIIKLKYEEEDVTVNDETVEGYVLLPFMAGVSPGAVIDDVESLDSIPGKDQNLQFKITYNSFASGGEVCVFSSVFTKDFFEIGNGDFGRIDPENGFIQFEEDDSNALNRVLNTFERDAGSQFWTLPQLLEVASFSNSYKNEEGDLVSELPEGYSQRLQWLAKAGSVTAFDVILNLLKPQLHGAANDSDVEGPVISGLIDFCEISYDEHVYEVSQNFVPIFVFSDDAHIGDLPDGSVPVFVLSETVIQNALYAAINKVLEPLTRGFDDEKIRTEFIVQLLESTEPNDDLGAFKLLINCFKGGSKFINEEYRSSLLSCAGEIKRTLGLLQNRIQDKSGSEAVLLHLLGKVFAYSIGDGGFLLNLIEKEFTNLEEKYKSQFRLDVGKILERALLNFTKEFKANYNGAEAARQLYGNMLLRALTVDSLGDPLEKRDLSIQGLYETLSLNEEALGFYVRRLGLKGGTGEDLLGIVAQRYWCPQAEMGPYMQHICSLLKTMQNQQADQYFELMEPRVDDLKLIIPDSTPAPLSIQIAKDLSGSDVEKFRNCFNGYGLLIKKDGGDWAHANLIELVYPTIDKHGLLGKQVVPAAVKPINSVSVDGRSCLFVEYNGLPLSGAAFESVGEQPSQQSQDERDAYKQLVSVEDIDGDELPDSIKQRLPRLGYGQRIHAAVFGVTRSGVLPFFLQRDAKTTPWLPKDCGSHGDVPSELSFLYQRRTAIGKVSIESLSRSKFGSVVDDGVVPLYDDYPRQSVSFTKEQVGRIDLFRNMDGRGAIFFKKDSDLEVPDQNFKIQINDLLCWGGKVKLQLQFMTLKVGQDKDSGRERRLVSEELYDDVHQIVIEVDQNEKYRNLLIQLKEGKLSAKIGEDVEGVAKQKLKYDGKPYWLRLEILSSDASDAATLSFADTVQLLDASNMSDSGFKLDYYSRPDQQKVELLGEQDVWKESVPVRLYREVVYPRVGYLDFDRWVGNPSLRKELWGLTDKAFVNELINFITDSYLRRECGTKVERERLSAGLDRLPDPSVYGLLIQLSPEDSLEVENQINTKSEELCIPIVDCGLGKIWDQEEDRINKPDKFIGEYIAFIERVDSLHKIKVEVLMGDLLPGAKKLVYYPEENLLKVTLPESMTMRLRISPLVSKKHFYDDIFDAGIAGHSKGEFLHDKELFYVFSGDEMVVEGMTPKFDEGKLREFAEKAIVCDTSGTSRSYKICCSETDLLRDERLHWRKLSDFQLMTQRWRFSGRPIYNWINPRDYVGSEPEVDLSTLEVAPDMGAGVEAEAFKAFHQFEKEIFIGRDDGDAMPKTPVRLSPIRLIPGIDEQKQNLELVDWAEPSATMYRHRYSLYSRYRSAMLNVKDGEVHSWRYRDEKDEDKLPALPSWSKRVVFLAEASRLPLSRPQVRALLPLTHAPRLGKGIKTPPILSVLEEKPFAYGGLANRLLGEIKTGVHFGFSNDNKDGKDALKKDVGEDLTVVQPMDTRKEVGPDPRLYMEPTPEKTASSMSLLQEGPIGLTFDSPSIDAAAWSNCQHIFSPSSLFDSNANFEEHAIGTAFRHFLDPNWTVGGKSKSLSSVPIEDSQYIKLNLQAGYVKLEGASGVVPKILLSLKLIKVNEKESEQKDGLGSDSDDAVKSDFEFSLAINSKAVYKVEKPKIPWLELCRFSYEQGSPGELYLLHQMLADGVCSATILYRDNSPVNGLVDKTPRIMASLEWSPSSLFAEKEEASESSVSGKVNGSLPINSEQRGLELKFYGLNETTALIVDSQQVAASAPTEIEWIHTARDSDSVYRAGDLKTPVPVKSIIASVTSVNGKDELSFNKIKGENSVSEVGLFLVPKLGEERIPKNIHRHLALMFTEKSDELGRQYETFRSSALLSGKSLEHKSIMADKLRIIEFETPAFILLSSKNEDVASEDKRLAQYLSAYIDFSSTVGDEAPEEFRFLMRPIQNGGLESIKLTFSPKLMNEARSITLNLNESKNGVVRLFEVIVQKDGVIAKSISVSGKSTDVLNADDSPLPDSSFLSQVGVDLSMSFVSSSGANISELWADVSCLHSKESKSGNHSFDFDWIFSDNASEQSPQAATSLNELRKLKEAQARIVSVSPPITIGR